MMHNIPERIDSTFRYILLAARRAEQLMLGARPKIETQHARPSKISMREISDELVEWDYGPAPAPPAPVLEDGEPAPESTD